MNMSSGQLGVQSGIRIRKKERKTSRNNRDLALHSKGCALMIIINLVIKSDGASDRLLPPGVKRSTQ